MYSFYWKMAISVFKDLPFKKHIKGSLNSDSSAK